MKSVTITFSGRFKFLSEDDSLSNIDTEALALDKLIELEIAINKDMSTRLHLNVDEIITKIV